jgi:hypothetical protein
VIPTPLRTLGHGGLLVLAIDLPTGGVAGSRAEEVNNSHRWVQGLDGAAPRVARGVVGRALDAAAEPVTITGRQEATHPAYGATA